jgi:hypothetical protein
MDFSNALKRRFPDVFDIPIAFAVHCKCVGQNHWLSALAVISLGGCLSTDLGTDLPANPEPMSGDTQFYVSNQSFADPEARITIHVDDQLVFSRVAKVEQQHTWYSFQLQLANGTHHLEAYEIDTQARLRQEFNKEGPTWITVVYWDSPSRFEVNVSQEPVYFA